MAVPRDTPAVETHALARSFGERVAVASLDLLVPAGSLFGLVGPDGAGKSTAIRLLAGILRPTSGQGRVLGFDLASESESVKARIGYLSQQFTLYGDLTVDENIEFFGDLHGVAGYEQRRDELLKFTRLAPFRKRLAGALSGGMKKKLALACTLIHTPELLLLDEPSTGVDPVSRGEFWNILGDILDRGVTVVLTTPYLDEVERCSLVGLMDHGRVFMTGTPDEIRRRMPGEVFEIVSASPATAYRVLRSAWPSSSLVLYEDRLRLWTAAGENDARRAAGLIESEGLGAATVRRATPSLEDAFVALIAGGESRGGPHAGE